MPFIDVIFKKKISALKFDPINLKERIKKHTGDALSVKTFSVRFFESHGLDELANDIEVRITADDNPERRHACDTLAKSIEEGLNSYSAYSDIKLGFSFFFSL